MFVLPGSEVFEMGAASGAAIAGPKSGSHDAARRGLRDGAFGLMKFSNLYNVASIDGEQIIDVPAQLFVCGAVALEAIVHPPFGTAGVDIHAGRKLERTQFPDRESNRTRQSQH